MNTFQQPASAATSDIWLNLGFLHEAVQNFSNQNCLDHFWACVCDNSRWVVPAKCMCVILRPAANSFKIVGRLERGAFQEPDDLLLPITNDFVGQALHTKGIQWFKGPWAESPCALVRWITKDNPVAILSSPLQQGDEQIGAMLFGFRILREQDETMLGSMALGYSLYVGMTNAILQTTRELARTNQILEAEILERRQAQEELAAARDQAVEASRLKSELLAKVSHELRTPLGTILGYSEYLYDGIFGALSNQQQKITRKIINSTNYLTNMVNDLLDQSRYESGEITLNNELFKTKRWLKAVDTQTRVPAEAKGLKLTFTIANNMPSKIYGDEKRLQQILVNLTGNAIKFTPSGQVEVELFQPAPDQWAMRVSDSGPGIPPEAQIYIFEPFRQIDGSETRQNRGAGLGLSIVNQLVTQMGGQILLDSEIGQGSTFTVILPLLPVQERER
ncbi:MAG: HAMP domain-containing histidine kinase [Anaerolineales bacterium]|nr:HAMP domain-containing histidine kinase [Anaerolineales bacterium]